MRYATPMRRGAGPTLEDALGQVPGLPFIPEDVAPTAPGGADAAVADLHHPDAEEIRPGLHAVLPQAAVSGISGLEGDAEVEHGAVKYESVYMTISRQLDFPFSVKKAVKEIKIRKRYDAAGFFTSRRAPASVTESSVGGACRGSGRWSRAGGRPAAGPRRGPAARVDLGIDKGRCQPLLRSDIARITPFMLPVLVGPGWLHDRSGRGANRAVGVDMIAESDVNNIKCKIGFVYETGEE